MEGEWFVILLFISFCTGFAATFIFRALAHKSRLVNMPNPIVPQHVKPVAYLGGLAVACGSFASLSITSSILSGSMTLIPPTLQPGYDTALVFGGGSAFLILGLIDDVLQLKPFTKLFYQVVLAVSIVLLLGLYCNEICTIGGLALNVLWIVAIVNAVNFTDVCDGLVSGLSVIALVVIVLSRTTDTAWAIALIGTLCGFLVYNFPPASIFLGDAGSHFLGFILAVMTLPEKLIANGTPGFGILLLSVFIFELIFITRMRILKGLKWWKGSPDHFSLRMQAAGFGKIQTVITVWAISALCGITALLMVYHASSHLIIGLVLVILVIAYHAWHWLKRHEVSSNDKKQEIAI